MTESGNSLKKCFGFDKTEMWLLQVKGDLGQRREADPPQAGAGRASPGRLAGWLALPLPLLSERLSL